MTEKMLKTTLNPNKQQQQQARLHQHFGVSNVVIFVQTKVFSRITFIWNNLYCSKNETFWNEGTIVRTVPVQEVDILKNEIVRKIWARVFVMYKILGDWILFSELNAKV